MSGFMVRCLGLLGMASVVALSACGSKVVSRAPVEDRGIPVKPVVVLDERTPLVKQPPGFENAGKPGYYTVKPGDTLIHIALETGQSRKDLTRWNALENPDRIEIGQVLRITTPVAGSDSSVVALAKPVVSSAAAVPAIATTPEPAKATAAAPASGGDESLDWIWPGKGAVVAGFDEVKNKGLDLGGTAGDPVVAAADGRVVYSGAGLRGYGNLIILKHNNTYLTAYAHNQALMVKEDQSVKKGQKIAEMGNSDADRVKLHFEVRRQGKPVDPAKYLPAR
jgi:lipoprotein NlpD